MERFAFIHGSSVGQSAFIPTNAPATICNDIANKYFQGRTLRQKESATKLSLFIDLYKSLDGNSNCVYSFVNNNCRGANGREGQYFAITIICKGVYVYPEAIYRMLYSAYSQMFATGKIIGVNKEGEEQYIISQFSEENEYLSVFLKKIENVFDNIANGLGKVIDLNFHVADYDSWRGTKVNIDACNSMATYKDLCDIGRLYISEEYESPSERIKVLEEYVKKMEGEKTEMEHRDMEAKRLGKSKVRGEIENLNLQIKKKDAEIDSLLKENNGYKATIATVCNELEKYAKIGKSISNIQGRKSQYQSKSKKDILKICLLFVVLALTILSSLLNYCFFRNISSSFGKDKETSEIVADEKQHNSSNQVPQTSQSSTSTSLVISPNSVESEANGGEYSISIVTDGEWNVPDSPADWIELNKIDNERLSVVVKPHKSQDMRGCTFMIKTETSEEQIRVTQEGKSVDTAAPVDYGIVVKDTDGNVLQQGAVVKKGQQLTVTVSNLSIASTGFGWKYWNCTGNKQNVREVTVTVQAQKGNEVIISYGDTSANGYRQRFKLKL